MPEESQEKKSLGEIWKNCAHKISQAYGDYRFYNGYGSGSLPKDMKISLYDAFDSDIEDKQPVETELTPPPLEKTTFGEFLSDIFGAISSAIKETLSAIIDGLSTVARGAKQAAETTKNAASAVEKGLKEGAEGFVEVGASVSKLSKADLIDALAKLKPGVIEGITESARLKSENGVGGGMRTPNMGKTVEARKRLTKAHSEL